MTQTKRLYGDYKVEAYDANDTLIQSVLVENTGTVEIGNVFEEALANQLERIEVTPLCVEARANGDTITRICADDVEMGDLDEE